MAYLTARSYRPTRTCRASKQTHFRVKTNRAMCGLLSSINKVIWLDDNSVCPLLLHLFFFLLSLKGEAGFERSSLLQCCFYVLFIFSLFIELLDWLTLFQNAKTTKYWAAPTEKWHTAQRKNFATTLLRLDGIVSKERREQKCPLGAPLRADVGLMVRDG